VQHRYDTTCHRERRKTNRDEWQVACREERLREGKGRLQPACVC